MSMKAIRQKIREKTGNKALSAMTPWNALREVETTPKGWSNYFRHSICGQPFARTWEYDDKRLGLMHSRWKQKEHTGRYKDLKLLGLKLPSPPPQNIYKRHV